MKTQEIEEKHFLFSADISQESSIMTWKVHTLYVNVQFFQPVHISSILFWVPLGLKGKF